MNIGRGKQITKQEFLHVGPHVLRDIETGAVSVELTEGDILESKVKYQASNGWTLVVFSDGDDSDYVSSIVPPSGECFELWPEQEEDDSVDLRALCAYQPPADQLTKNWGFLT